MFHHSIFMFKSIYFIMDFILSSKSSSWFCFSKMWRRKLGNFISWLWSRFPLLYVWLSCLSFVWISIVWYSWRISWLRLRLRLMAILCFRRCFSMRRSIWWLLLFFWAIFFIILFFLFIFWFFFIIFRLF